MNEPAFSIPAHTAEKAMSLGGLMRTRSMVATSLGNGLEWFDWTIYAVFSTYIAKALFNPADPKSALLSTLAVFAVGFVSRPLGGIFFGRLADRKGRKAVLLSCMLLMGIGSLMIALIPSYAQIGGWASFLILVARLLQGFAHGGESTASYAYVAEIAPKERRAFWSSSMFFSVGLGSILATLLGAMLNRLIPTEQMNAWGWRLPFYFGALLSVAILFMRRGMMESDVLESHLARIQTPSEWSKAKILKCTIGIFFYQAGVGLPYYIWTGYAAIFAITQRGMDPSKAFLASVFAQIVYIIATPIWGRISDRVGRKPLAILYFIAVAVLSYPLIKFISGDPWTLFLAQGLMLALTGIVGGTMPAILAEQIPTRYRSRILGIALPISVALFGGTAPYLSSWFSGMKLEWAFNVYVVIIVLIAAYVVWGWKETKGIDLRDVA
ncbi:MFS transporter [Massilia orientalis]|uniref:MFS transporter n=1 Tax=Massilia orientalis TaxID=3050128 RepID=A0ACC7MK94_9BURK|nr:MFS transporter [Massilia sp. YIM B02787]